MNAARSLAIAFLLAAMPLPLLADDVQFSNNGGSFTSNAAKTTLTLSGSGLFAITGLTNFGINNTTVALPCSACLGSVSLTTATLATGVLNASGPGSVGTTATFNPGGIFTVTSSLGGGMVFTGSFSDASWKKVAGGVTGGTWTFTGTIMNGTLTIGGNVTDIPTAVTIQLTTVGSGFTTNANGSVSFANNQGTTNFVATPVPEPGTLTLLGSGLVLLGALARRRIAGTRIRTT